MTFQIYICFIFRFSFKITCKLKITISNKKRIDFSFSLTESGPFGGSCQIHGPLSMAQSESEDLTKIADCDDNATAESIDIKSPTVKNPAFSHLHCPPEIHRSCFCVRFIAEHTKLLEESTKVTIIFLAYKNLLIYINYIHNNTI